MLVISPYSTFLSLHVDASAAMRNLRRMEARAGWVPTDSMRRQIMHRFRPPQLAPSP